MTNLAPDGGSLVFGLFLVVLAILAVSDTRIVPKAIGRTVVSIGVVGVVLVVAYLVASNVPV